MIRIVTIIISAAVVVVILLAIFFFVLPANHIKINSGVIIANPTMATATPQFVVTHIAPPPAVKGIYFTNWAAGTPSFRKNLYSLLDDTILNSVVIDVKDYSGFVGVEMDNPVLTKMGVIEKRIPKIKEFIGTLHDKGVYVIGRVAVFQDPLIVKIRPEWAVTNASTGKLWKDSGGALWADPTNKKVWEYNALIAKEAYALGFDEINFDYIRFPSDGAVSSAVYSALLEMGKSQVIRGFFEYLHSELTFPISADLFGQVTSDSGDMGIGQLLEDAMPYFDYIDPMVYPSHYINGFIGIEKPATRPYEIVKYAMDRAVARSVAASSSPLLMRPWLQAFDLGAIYTPEMVRAQILATYDAGLTSWILWNAGSVYDKTALLTEPKSVGAVSKISTASSIRP